MATDRSKILALIRRLSAPPLSEESAERIRAAFNASLEGQEILWKVPVFTDPESPNQIMVLDLTQDGEEN